MKLRLGLCTLVALCLAQSAPADDWANVTIKFVLDGTPPVLKPLDSTKDPLCGVKDVPNESLLINPTNKGIANLVLMVDKKKSKLTDDQIHPTFKDVPQAPVLLDNIKCQFVPHVFAVRAGQKIEIKNSDATGHNANFSVFENDAWNESVPAGSSKFMSTKKPEAGPTPVSCGSHNWMTAYPVIIDHPYVGISDTNGVIKLEKVPANVELTFKLWHESQNKFDDVTVNGKTGSWPKGVVKFTFKPGDNDLGTVGIKPERFKSK